MPLNLVVGLPFIVAVFLVDGVDLSKIEMIMAVLTPLYLACLYWPIPLFVFRPEKFSKPGMLILTTFFSFVLLISLALGSFALLSAGQSGR